MHKIIGLIAIIVLLCLITYIYFKPSYNTANNTSDLGIVLNEAQNTLDKMILAQAQASSTQPFSNTDICDNYIPTSVANINSNKYCYLKYIITTIYKVEFKPLEDIYNLYSINGLEKDIDSYVYNSPIQEYVVMYAMTTALLQNSIDDYFTKVFMYNIPLIMQLESFFKEGNPEYIYKQVPQTDSNGKESIEYVREEVKDANGNYIIHGKVTIIMAYYDSKDNIPANITNIDAKTIYINTVDGLITDKEKINELRNDLNNNNTSEIYNDTTTMDIDVISKYKKFRFSPENALKTIKWQFNQGKPILLQLHDIYMNANMDDKKLLITYFIMKSLYNTIIRFNNTNNMFNVDKYNTDLSYIQANITKNFPNVDLNLFAKSE